MPEPGSSRVAKARRGGRGGDAVRAQAELGDELREQMRARRLSAQELATGLGIKVQTLKTYISGQSPWPWAVLREVDDYLHRDYETDLIRLGVFSTPATDKVVVLTDALHELRRRSQAAAEGLSSISAVAAHTGVVDAAAQIVSLLVPVTQAGDAGGGPFRQGIQVFDLARGISERQRFARLVLLRTDANVAIAEAALLEMPVEPWYGRLDAVGRHVLDAASCFIEHGHDYLDELSKKYKFNPEQDLAIIAPWLLAPRQPQPAVYNKSLQGADSLVVTSLDWGGAADVAGKLALQRGMGFATVTQQVDQSVDAAMRPYYGGAVKGGTDAEQVAQHARRRAVAEERSLACLDITMSGRGRSWALDDARAAIAALTAMAAKKPTPAPTSPLIMIKMGERRIKWTARARVLADLRAELLLDGNPAGSEAVVASYNGRADLVAEVSHHTEQLVGQQAELEKACALLKGNRPVFVLDLGDHDHYDTGASTVDPDFDLFMQVARRADAWIAELAESAELTSAAKAAPRPGR